MPTDWRIRKKQGECAACEKSFEEGDRHFSLLLVDPESLGRVDRCLPCFEASLDVGSDAVFWRTSYRPKAKRGLSVDFESILRLFMALEGREEERLSELRYLLTLLLMRKKHLKLVRVKRGGVDADGVRTRERMVMRRPRSEDTHDVVVYDLSPERTAVLRADLERIFEGAGAEDLLVPPPLLETESEVGPAETDSPGALAAGDAGAGSQSTSG